MQDSSQSPPRVRPHVTQAVHKKVEDRVAGMVRAQEAIAPFSASQMNEVSSLDVAEEVVYLHASAMFFSV